MIPRNAADNVREDRFPPLDSKLPINRWHKYAEWRRRKTEKTKNLERNRNRNREREREKFGREERIDEADTGQRYVRRIENRDSPRVMPHTRILTLIVC